MQADEMVRSWRLRSGVVQANTIKGWRYLDLTGLAVNKLSDTYADIQVNENGTLLTRPSDIEAPTDIQFTQDRIVLRYIPLESLQRVKDTSTNFIRSIAESLEVTRFNRLGFRAEYFIQVDNLEAVSRIFLDNVRPSGIASQQHVENEPAIFQLQFPIQSGEFAVILRIKSVQMNRPQQRPQDYAGDGISFDADVYQRGEFSRSQISRFVTAAGNRLDGLVGEIAIPLLEGVPI